MAKLKKSASLSKAERETLKKFGERVRAIREEKRLSVYDVTGEDMLVKTRQHWQRIENGQKNINLTTVVKVAKSLEVTPEALVKGLQWH